MSIILKVKNLNKEFKGAEKNLHVLKNINFELEKASTLSIVGPSGSGKTTLLGLCAGLDQISAAPAKVRLMDVFEQLMAPAHS